MPGFAAWAALRARPQAGFRTWQLGRRFEARAEPSRYLRKSCSAKDLVRREIWQFFFLLLLDMATMSILLKSGAEQRSTGTQTTLRESPVSGSPTPDTISEARAHPRAPHLPRSKRRPQKRRRMPSRDSWELIALRVLLPLSFIIWTAVCQYLLGMGPQDHGEGQAGGRELADGISDRALVARVFEISRPTNDEQKALDIINRTTWWAVKVGIGLLSKEDMADALTGTWRDFRRASKTPFGTAISRLRCN